MVLPDDVAAYNARLTPADREICVRLATVIAEVLPEADARVWHAHPVWFLDGNPIVGYHRLTASVRLLFWSGRSFPTPGLTDEGTFQAAEVRYPTVADIDEAALRAWLAEARDIQWDYEHIRASKGRLSKRTVF